MNVLRSLEVYTVSVIVDPGLAYKKCHYFLHRSTYKPGTDIFNPETVLLVLFEKQALLRIKNQDY